MWPDNETRVDLLGFRVHAQLLQEVVTDPSVLPVTVGVFGDWGSGKSSIMQMLRVALEEQTSTVCLYFNSWVFEGYEDAKTALLSSILVELGEHKRFGPKVRDGVVSLLRRVKWMDVAKLGAKHVGIPLGFALAIGGVGALPAALASVASMAMPAKSEPLPDESTPSSTASIDWGRLVRQKDTKPDLLETRKFRDEFEALLGHTDLSQLVVLIDDLDRCLPERIIETLEAIKLFVAVPKTAFIIGADPRIVDAQGSVRVHRGLTLFAYGLNLNNEVFGFYNGAPQYVVQREYYKPTIAGGVRWLFSREK